MNSRHIYNNTISNREAKYKQIMIDKDNKELIAFKKRVSPTDYFILFSKYNDIYTIEFKANSQFFKTYNIIKGDIHKYFYSLSVTKLGDSYTIHCGYSDMVKLFLVDDIRDIFNFKSNVIKGILTLLRYRIHKKVSEFEIKDKELTKEIAIYLKYPEDRDITQNKIKICKMIEKYNIHLLYHYTEQDNFEKILYYIAQYNKSPHIFIEFNTAKLPIRISYIHNKLDSVFHNRGLIFSIIRYLGYGNKDGQKQTYFDRIIKTLNIKSKNDDKLLDGKSSHIMKLEKKLNTLSKKELYSTKEYKLLEKELEKEELEYSLGIYEIDNKIKVKKRTNSSKMIEIELFENIVPHINNTHNGEIHININKSKLAEFSVYSKHESEDLDKLKKEYPFAEIGGVQYKGKRQYTTVRYKKILK